VKRRITPTKKSGEIEEAFFLFEEPRSKFGHPKSEIFMVSKALFNFSNSIESDRPLNADIQRIQINRSLLSLKNNFQGTNLL
jgi:hypothetical protein